MPSLPRLTIGLNFVDSACHDISFSCFAPSIRPGSLLSGQETRRYSLQPGGQLKQQYVRIKEISSSDSSMPMTSQRSSRIFITKPRSLTPPLISISMAVMYLKIRRLTSSARNLKATSRLPPTSVRLSCPAPKTTFCLTALNLLCSKH